MNNVLLIEGVHLWQVDNKKFRTLVEEKKAMLPYKDLRCRKEREYYSWTTFSLYRVYIQDWITNWIWYNAIEKLEYIKLSNVLNKPND